MRSKEGGRERERDGGPREERGGEQHVLIVLCTIGYRGDVPHTALSVYSEVLRVNPGSV